MLYLTHLQHPKGCQMETQRSTLEARCPAAGAAITGSELCKEESSPGQCSAPAELHASSLKQAGERPSPTGKLRCACCQIWPAFSADAGHSQSQSARSALSSSNRQARQQVSLH